MTYPEALRYLNSFVNYEKEKDYPYRKSFKLEKMEGFLKLLKNPQESLSCLHIAGSKGKGSTCAFIAYILREAGFKIGLYTSPHLVDFRERIRILSKQQKPETSNQPAPAKRSGPGKPEGRERRTEFEGMISKKEIVNLIERLKPFIEKYNRTSQYGSLTFFEVYTALAFIYFKEKKVDFAVLETGLGGRLDATNVVNALVSVLTPISYEHMRILGRTLKAIATQKAGIIKVHSSVVITAPQEKEVMEVIRKKCKKVGARLSEIGKDIRYRKTKNGFSVKGIYGRYADLRIRLIGSHQLINAVVAISAVRALQSYNIKVGIDSIRRGFYNTLWPGRCEVLSRNPLVVLDGAQNVASARVLKEAVKDNFKYRNLILVLGISDDKDIKGICGQLIPISDTVILTQADNPRAAHVERIEDIMRDMAAGARGQKVIKSKNIKEAIEIAKRKAEREDLILITGSLFVIGEARSAY
jgi:dihydrofolate synthase/folylpolyglutamate synthase